MVVINYKRWAIRQRIKELKKFLRLLPASENTPRREEELFHLEEELKELDEPS